MRKSIAIVGAGAVGRALGRKLHESSWAIGSVICRTNSSAREAVRFIGAGKPSSGLTPLVLNSDVVLIAVPSGDLAAVVAKLAVIGGDGWKGKAVFHTSESHNHSALDAVAALAAAPGSLHPLQIFERNREPRLEGICFGIEGSPAALKVGRRIVHDVGGIAVRSNAVRCGVFGLAVRFANHDIEFLVRACTQLLMSVGFSSRQAQRASTQLARQTLLRLERERRLPGSVFGNREIAAALLNSQREMLNEISGDRGNLYPALRMRAALNKPMDIGRNSWQH